MLHSAAAGFVVAALCLLAVRPARGQVDVSSWPQVRVEVLALTAQGDSIPGLTQDALLLQEDGKNQGMVDIKAATQPQSVCLLIDSSGSMYERRTALVGAATRLINALPAEDEVCVADFSWHSYLDQKLTLNRQLDLKALSNIKYSGGSAVRDSLLDLSNYMQSAAPHASRAILLLSDGSDNASKVDEEQMKRQIESSGGVAVHVICVPFDPGKDSGNTPLDKKAALHLAATFGGLTYFPRNAQDTDASVDHLVAAMNSRYLLTYQAVDTARNGRQRLITLALDKAHQKAKAVVRAPEGYYAPSQ